MKPFTRTSEAAAAISRFVFCFAIMCSGLAANSPRADAQILPSPSSFSDGLSQYLDHPTARTRSARQILDRTSTPGVELPTATISKRLAIVGMYRRFGIDISLDNENPIQSDILVGLSPTSWSQQTPQPLTGDFLQPFSVDAPFYHRIPPNPPNFRVNLPRGYFDAVQLTTVQNGGDGIGIPIVISGASDPVRTIVSEFDGVPDSRSVFSDNIRDDWQDFRGATTYGDKHVTFFNRSKLTQINGYSVDPAPNGTGIRAQYAAGPCPLASLGDRCGSTAAKVADAGPLLRPGEATNANVPIPHALSGPVYGIWKARVYPASGMDGFIDGDGNCGGPANTGLVPYGGVVQLDPKLVFRPVPGTTDRTVSVGGRKITVSLPAFRILEAMQNYGYYVVDYGCYPLGIYTNVNDDEFGPFGGSFGVQQQLTDVLSRANVFVVPPLVKK